MSKATKSKRLTKSKRSTKSKRLTKGKRSTQSTKVRGGGKSPSPSPVHILRFYAPWCGACQASGSDWETFAAAMEHYQHIHVENMSSDETDPTKLATAHAWKTKHNINVRYYPMIVKVTQSPDGTTHTTEFKGERTPKQLYRFATTKN